MWDERTDGILDEAWPGIILRLREHGPVRCLKDLWQLPEDALEEAYRECERRDGEPGSSLWYVPLERSLLASELWTDRAPFVERPESVLLLPQALWVARARKLVADGRFADAEKWLYEGE